MKRRQLLPSQLAVLTVWGSREICGTEMVISRPGIAGVDLGVARELKEVGIALLG